MKNKIKKKLHYWVSQSYWYNEVLFKDCRKFWEMNVSNLDVINLGSSSGVYDFDYSGLSVKGMNWAVAPQTIYGDFAILKQFASHLKKGATIIYPLCPFTSISGAVKYVEDRCYSFLDLENIPDGHYLRMIKVKQMQNNPLLFYPLLSILRDLKHAVRKNGENTRILDEFQMIEDAKLSLNSWNDQFHIDDLSAPFVGKYKVVYDDGTKLLKEMSVFCKEKHLRFIIVIPPMYKTLAACFSPSARENLIDSFVRNGIDSSVLYLNMMDDENFTNDISLFRSSYYLNTIGAKKYTSYLLNKINI